MKKYESYKDSGVGFVDEIPQHWKMGRLGFVAKVIDPQPDHRAPALVEDGYPYLGIRDINDDGSVNFETARKVSLEAVEKQENSFIIKDGDILFCKVGTLGEPKHLILPNARFAISATLVIIKVADHADSRFIKYALESNLIDYQIYSVVTGSTRPALGIQQIRKLLLCLPPVNEQELIADFLLVKVSQIDSLIQKKQQLIVLLEKEKTAVINEAVTKGLNPDAPMKDSGLELFEEVPAHWNIIPLRYIGECQNGVSEGAEYFGSGYPFVSYGDVYKNMILPNNVVGLAKSTESDRFRFSVKAGDVFFTRTSETVEEIGIASTCIKNIDDAVFAGFLIRFRPRNGVLYEGFSKYYFRSNTVRTFFVKEMNLVTRASLSQELLKRLSVLLPPHEEQQKITVFLDHEMERIQGVINKSKKEISLLQEYRTALISEAVTGKIDVRDYQLKSESEPVSVN